MVGSSEAVREDQGGTVLGNKQWLWDEDQWDEEQLLEEGAVDSWRDACQAEGSFGWEGQELNWEDDRAVVWERAIQTRDSWFEQDNLGEGVFDKRDKQEEGKRDVILM